MDLYLDIREAVIDALNSLVDAGELARGMDYSAVTIEPPRDTAHGDMATNAAMVLAKQAGQKPQILAQKLCQHLQKDRRIETAQPAGPGFVNLSLAPSLWQEAVRDVLEKGHDFGRCDIGKGRQANIEFVSANPTGPLHVGNGRGAVYGDALASLLAYVGYEVTREYYINDAGAQVQTLARSAHLRYCEAHGKPCEIGEDLYPGEYLIPVGRALKKQYGDGLLDKTESDWLEPVALFAIEHIMQTIREDMALIGVRMDSYISERELAACGRVEAAIERLQEKNLVYTGTLEPPKTSKAKDWQPRPQLLFRSTDYGDDTDRPLQKLDGSWTYFAPDIAYHYDKLCRGFALIIDVFGAEHAGYVKRMQAVVNALAGEEVEFDVKICQLVRLFRDGKPVKMSKRSGAFVGLREMVEEVGVDAARFLLLTRKNDVTLDFDFKCAVEQSRDNPVFYVQYAHTRCCSAFRQAEAQNLEVNPKMLAKADLSLLSDKGSLTLARKIAQWPRRLRTAAQTHEPHRIAIYLQELATDLHALWTQGRDDENMRFIRKEAPETTSARLALLRATANVLSVGLTILGVRALEEMR